MIAHSPAAPQANTPPQVDPDDRDPAGPGAAKIDLEGRVVLQVLPALDTGGVERGTIEMARAITEAGGYALVASAGGRLLQRLRQVGGDHLTLPLLRRDPLTIWRNVDRLAEIIEARKVDLVHVRSRAPAWSAYFAARKTGRPLITTFHGTYGLKGPLKKRYNAIMTRGDRVIAISNFIAEHIRHQYGIDEERLRIVPRGVDLASFDPDQVSGQRMINLIQGWRVPEDRPIIMLPGRLTRWKGQLDFLEAAALLPDLEASWVLLGDDQGRSGYRRELEKRIDALGLADRVFLPGSCADMAAAYRVAAVVVSASNRPEAFGRVAVEAQAMGRPLVATNHGGSRETVIHGDTGWLVPSANAAAMAAAIHEAFHLDESARAALADRARAHVAESFTIDLMCGRTLAIYRETLTAG